MCMALDVEQSHERVSSMIVQTRRVVLRCVTPGMAWIMSLAVLVAVGSAAGAIDYQKLAVEKLGGSKAGIVFREIEKGEWEVVAVASGAIESMPDASDVQAYRQALLMAGALARQSLGEFIGGVKVKGREQLKTDATIAIDGRQKEATTAKFVDFIQSYSRQDVYAFLRGTRQVGDWKSQDGREAFVAVAISAEDVRRSAVIGESIALASVGEDRFQVIESEGVDRSPRRVRVWGMAAHAGGSIAGARRAAIYDALQLAVERVAGLTLVGKTSVTNLKRLKAHVSSMTTGFVESFMIVKEEDIGGQYRVLIEATIQSNPFINDDVIRLLLGSPTVVVCGQPAGVGGGNYIITDMPTSLVGRGISVDGARYSANSLAEAFPIARKQGASVLVWADTDEWAEAYSVVTEQRIGSRISGTYYETGRRTWAKAFPDFCDSILAYWRDEVFNGIHVSIIVSNNTGAYRQLASLRGIIQSIEGCKSAKQVYADSGSKKARFDVRFAGLMEDFLDALMEELDTSPDENLKKVDVEKQEGNVVFLNL